LPLNLKYDSDIFLASQKTNHPFRLGYQKIDNKIICDHCIDYTNNYNPTLLKTELDWSISKEKNLPYDAIVSFSGGKDSLVALYLATQVYGLKVLVYFYQNDFIPEEVVERVKHYSEYFNSDLHIHKKSIKYFFDEEYQLNSKNEKLVPKTGVDICQVCSKEMNFKLWELTEKYQTQKVIYGINVYTQLKPSVSGISKYSYKDKNLYAIALPFLSGITYQSSKKILKILKYKKLRSLKGYTSNCLIPGLTQYILEKNGQARPDIAYISKELRSGYFQKGEFLKIQTKKISKTWFDSAMKQIPIGAPV
jgi:predicted PP-loop superfamily ATPase